MRFKVIEVILASCIVIGLIGMLAVAIIRAYDYGCGGHPAPNPIEQLQNAMHAYKEMLGQYPPSLADAVLEDRKARFMRHVKVAFPDSNYGVTPADFDNLRNKLGTPDTMGRDSQVYNYRDSSGSSRPLDLNTLDQAEALVFWLGGFPTPCTKSGIPVAPPRTYGFNRDRDNPFRRDPPAAEATDPLRFRTEPRMDFRQNRFADADNDGWLEYLPDDYVEGTLQAPYVYFDAPTYVASTTPPGQEFDIVNLVGYPRALDRESTKLATAWGLAVPLAESYDANAPAEMKWADPQTFQIIAPGKDGKYSASESGDLAAAMRLSVYPSGDTYRKSSNYKTRGAYSVPELDNYNNLGRSTLEGARSESKK